MPDAPKFANLTTKGTGKPRPSSTARGYDTKHRKLAAQRRHEHPICEYCHDAWSVDADHLVYPARSVDDYRATCRSCHNKKTHGR